MVPKIIYELFEAKLDRECMKAENEKVLQEGQVIQNQMTGLKGALASTEKALADQKILY